MGETSNRRQHTPSELGAATSCPPSSEGAGRKRTPAMGHRAVLRPYLHELDRFMHDRKDHFDQGHRRKANPAYHRYTDKIYRLRKTWETLRGKEGNEQQLQHIEDEIRRVDQLRKQLPSGDPFDQSYKRLYYCRYVDDFCIGIIGSHADAERIRQEVRRFIHEHLKLTIAEEKAHISPSKTGVTFVGYELRTYSGDRIVKVQRGTRHTRTKSISEQIQLHIPRDKMQKFCSQKGYGNYAPGTAMHKSAWTRLTDAEIILAYNAELRGLANYYALAIGAKSTMHKLEWIWQTSLFKTLANKHRTSVNKIATWLKTEQGQVLTVKGEHTTRSIQVFRLKDLKKPKPNSSRLEIEPNTNIWTLSSSEVIKRLEKRQCEYCETTVGPFEVHHIRKMKDVAKGKQLWQRIMALRYRKTLVLCRTCHHRLHAGTLPDRDHLKKCVKGEPCAVKAASTVLRGGAG